MTNSALHFQVTSYPKNGMLPVQHATEAAGGQNRSIGLQWRPLPAAQSYAFILEDKHPMANRWVHWLVVDIPPDATKIPQGASRTSAMPPESRELFTSWDRTGYDGPQPPVGSGSHEYLATLYALDLPKTGLSETADREAFLKLIEGHVIAEESWTGFFEK